MSNSDKRKSLINSKASNHYEPHQPCACCLALSTVVRSPNQQDASRQDRQQHDRLQQDWLQHNRQEPAPPASRQHDLINRLLASKTLGYSKGQPETDQTGSTGNATSENITNQIDGSATPKRRRLWQGIDGLAVMVFGVLLPSLLAVLGCASAPKRMTLVLLNHPLETIAELILLFGIPAVNYMAWSSLCRNNMRFTPVRGMALGATFCASAALGAICIAAEFCGSSQLACDLGTNFSTGFCFMGLIGVLAALSSAYILGKVRLSRELPQSRSRVTILAAAGAILALLTLVGAEARPWCIRQAEHMAVSNSATEQKEGLKWLRFLYPERELRMECSDPRAAGLSGLFIPLKSSSLHQLYFTLTGKPYSFRDATNTNLAALPDDYLSRNTVGDKVPGLTLTRSSLDGVIHPTVLSSTINWTMVLKNDSSQPQEARAEIKVPAGSAITGLTLWTAGEPHNAVIAASGGNGYNGASLGVDHPAMLTDLGRGRVLLHCYQVPQEEELKVRVTMVVPFHLDNTNSASASMPALLASNFDLQGEHQYRLRSLGQMSSTAAELKHLINQEGEQVLSGTQSSKQLEANNLVITVNRAEQTLPVAVVDKVGTELARQREEEKEEADRKKEENSEQTKQVVVMIDGSKEVERQLEGVTKALARKHSDSEMQKIKIKTVKAEWVRQWVTPIRAAAPKHLVVVVDGSATIGQHIDELTAALSRLPAGIPASLIIASQEDNKLQEAVALSEGLKNLHKVTFVGGQDNLQAVVKASELAGETDHGAVLWIHGPQPTINPEI